MYLRESTGKRPFAPAEISGWSLIVILSICVVPVAKAGMPF